MKKPIAITSDFHDFFTKPFNNYLYIGFSSAFMNVSRAPYAPFIKVGQLYFRIAPYPLVFYG